MDLLVLADSDGAVDMTHEAISRRTNVPLEEVQRYIAELCQPDAKSRSQLHEGKRLIPLDVERDWGWIIVNYAHYRQVRDEEARREYFRSAMRKSRKKKRVKDKCLTDLTTVNRVQPLASASSSVSKSRCTQKEAEEFCQSLGLPASDGTAMFLHWEEKGWGKVKDWKLTIRKWKSFGYLPSQKNGQRPKPKTGRDPYEMMSDKLWQLKHGGS